MTALYANRHGYTDIEPCEVVEVRTPNKMMIRHMTCERDPAWKMDFHPGGFFGHVANDRDQKWFIKPNPDLPLFAIRKRKDGRWFDAHGNRYTLNNQPHKFYDHNF